MNPDDYRGQALPIAPAGPKGGDVINDYAREISRIIENDTIGDFTWEGLLITFYHDMKDSRL